MTEEMKIQEMIKKYENIIQCSSCIDITKSVKGKWFVYLTDEKSGELDCIIRFKTSEELEQIILHEMANDLNLAIEVGLEDLVWEINEKNVSDISSELANAIDHLANSLDLIQKGLNTWSSRVKNSIEGFDIYFDKKVN